MSKENIENIYAKSSYRDKLIIFNQKFLINYFVPARIATADI